LKLCRKTGLINFKFVHRTIEIKINKQKAVH
jgi:hypothetical protein